MARIYGLNDTGVDDKINAKILTVCYSKVILAKPQDESIYGEFKTLREAKEKFNIDENRDTFIVQDNTLFVYLID